MIDSASQDEAVVITRYLQMLLLIDLYKIEKVYWRPLQNCLHRRIAALCATRRLAYLIDMSCPLCCGRLALHPVRLLLQRSLLMTKTPYDFVLKFWKYLKGKMSMGTLCGRNNLSRLLMCIAYLAVPPSKSCPVALCPPLLF